MRSFLLVLALAASVLVAAPARAAADEPDESQPGPGVPHPPEPEPDPVEEAKLPQAPAGTEPAPGAPSDKSTNESDKRVGVGLDGFFVLPVGRFADATGPLGGPITRFGYRVVAALEISVRAGYLFALSKDQGGGIVSRYDILPVWLEARYFVMQPYAGIYGAFDAGMNVYLPTITPPAAGPEGDKATQLRRRFGMNVGVGYVLSANLPIDLRLQVMVPNLVGQHADLKERTDVGVSLSSGYTLQF